MARLSIRWKWLVYREYEEAEKCRSMCMVIMEFVFLVSTASKDPGGTAAFSHTRSVLTLPEISLH